jgi:hypothetical protein
MKNARLLFAIAALPMNAKWIHQVDTCAQVADTKSPTVVILKQWHLPPSVNTKTTPAGARALPQAKNQKEIYEQLSVWVKNSNIDSVIAEGCEGEITPKFKDAFQGWSYADLDAHKKDKAYAGILSHVVLKLKVSYPGQVHALCGDSLNEIKKSQVALSDSRADVGYFSKLSENQNNPAKLKSFLEGVIEAYHLKSDATVTDAEKAVALDLKQSLTRFQDSTHERDLSFIRKVNLVESKKPVVVVIGGLHAEDLKQILEDKKMNCVIAEPVSYQNDEEAMSSKLKSLIH